MEKHQDYFDYLESLGFTKENIETLSKKNGNRNVADLKDCIDFWKSYMGVNNAKLRKIIMLAPTMITYDITGKNPTSINNKIDFYKNTFKYDDKTMGETLASYPWLLHLDTLSDRPTSVKSKIKYIQDELKITEHESVKIICKNFKILSSKKESLQKNIDYFRDYFQSDARKIFIAQHRLITDDVERFFILRRDPIMNLLKINEEQFIKVINKTPSLLAYPATGDRPDSIESKMKYYKNNLHLNDNELLNLILNKPIVLTLDVTTNGPTSVNKKLQAFTECMPFEKVREAILNTPTLLTTPAQQFKIRYMLAYDMGEEDKFFKINFMINEKKVWARYCFLSSTVPSQIDKVYIGEERFKKLFNISSEQLLEQYPLDENAVYDIEQTFAETTGRDLKLNQAERETVLGM